MIKEFYKSLSLREKDNIINFIWSLTVATLAYLIKDYSFIVVFIMCLSMIYVIDTIGYFRKYLTDDRRYTINIDNTHHVDSLTKKIVLNLHNPQWDKTHSWSFTSNESQDGKLKDSTDWV